MTDNIVFTPGSKPASQPMPKKHKPSSRLTKKEQKKLTQQTLITVVVAIVILLLFIFVLIPGLIRLFFRVLDDSANFDPDDTIPPQTPVLEAPYPATYSATVNLRGYGEAKSKIIFVLNGAEVDQVEADDQGQFEYELALDDGENTLSVYSKDGSDNESNIRDYNILRDAEPPFIELESPEDGANIELKKNQLTTIKGKTEAGAKVYINERMVYANSEGNFSSRYQLKEGENKIKFEIIDKAGNKSTHEITVHFKL